jgi:hypothetical protein
MPSRDASERAESVRGFPRETRFKPLIAIYPIFGALRGQPFRDPMTECLVVLAPVN